jgi:hypothetical protein
MEKGGKVDEDKNASILEVAETNFESACTILKKKKNNYMHFLMRLII